VTAPIAYLDGPPEHRWLSPVVTWRTWTLFLALFAIALFLDIPTSDWVHQTGTSAWLKNPTGHQLTLILRYPGRAYYTLTVCVILIFLGLRSRGPRALEDALLIALASLFSGINTIIKWIVGRTRPFHDVGDIHNVPPFHLIPFRGGLHGIFFAEQNLSFPSGDASLAFAMAAAMVMIAPRYRALWWTLGIIVAIERVLEGAHYPSDVTAGAALGIACALAARKLLRNAGNKNDLGRLDPKA
jgi:membrane-associated phospholipid phosphatase